jgi:hypothetical protein
LTDFEERARSTRQAGSNRSLNGSNFGIVNGQGPFAYSNYANHPGCDENGEPVFQVEPAKDITREKRELNFLDSVRPSAPGLVLREKPLITFTPEDGRDGILEMAPDSECEPWVNCVPRLHYNLHTVRRAESI